MKYLHKKESINAINQSFDVIVLSIQQKESNVSPI